MVVGSVGHTDQVIAGSGHGGNATLLARRRRGLISGRSWLLCACPGDAAQVMRRAWNGFGTWPRRGKAPKESNIEHNRHRSLTAALPVIGDSDLNLEFWSLSPIDHLTSRRRAGHHRECPARVHDRCTEPDAAPDIVRSRPRGTGGRDASGQPADRSTGNSMASLERIRVLAETRQGSERVKYRTPAPVSFRHRSRAPVLRARTQPRCRFGLLRYIKTSASSSSSSTPAWRAGS